MKQIIFLLLLCCLHIIKAYSSNIRTVTYFQNDTLSLQMDIIEPETSDANPCPAFIFVHGGGFSTGKRTEGIELRQFLAEKGFVTTSISYTLYMKGKDFGCKGIVGEKIKAIQYAANNIWQATSYLLEHSIALNIDPEKIFIAGASAGAEAVLQAAFWDRKTMEMYPIPLQDDFRYAGVISGAGALTDINIINGKNTIPALLFHGTEDKAVPYANAPHHYCQPCDSGWLILFGSYCVFEKLSKLNESVELVSYVGGGHEHCVTLFDEQKPVLEFLESVLNKQHFNIHQTIEP